MYKLHCEKCNKETEHEHGHVCAHGIPETHMVGSERYECTECGRAIYKSEGVKLGLKYILD